MMGVDLTVMPVSWVSGDRMRAYSAMELDRHREMFKAIQNAGIETDVPGPVTCYRARNADGDTCFGDVLKGPYDTTLTTASAGDLHRVMIGFALTGDNKWIFAALGAMPPMARVVLYWH